MVPCQIIAYKNNLFTVTFNIFTFNCKFIQFIVVEISKIRIPIFYVACDVLFIFTLRAIYKYNIIFNLQKTAMMFSQ